MCSLTHTLCAQADILDLLYEEFNIEYDINDPWTAILPPPPEPEPRPPGAGGSAEPDTEAGGAGEGERARAVCERSKEREWVCGVGGWVGVVLPWLLCGMRYEQCGVRPSSWLNYTIAPAAALVAMTGSGEEEGEAGERGGKRRRRRRRRNVKPMSEGEVGGGWLAADLPSDEDDDDDFAAGGSA